MSTGGGARRLVRWAGWAKWAKWIGLAFLLLVTISQIARMAAPWTAPGWDRVAFYDFRLWRSGLQEYSRSGMLYDVHTPGYYLPGSHSLYKYPPTFAALLWPFLNEPQARVARIFLFADIVVLLGAFTLLAWMFRPPRWRLALGFLVFILWRPTWESLSDLQMEPIMLICLAASFCFLWRRRDLAAGATVGLAGAFKVFPWALLIYFLWRRRWKAAVGVPLGGLAALALTALVLPARLTIEFFTKIFPHLGGTSLSYENLSLLGNTGRLASTLISGSASPETLDGSYLEAAGLGTRAVGLLLYLAAAVLLVSVVHRFSTGRGWSRGSGAGRTRPEHESKVGSDAGQIGPERESKVGSDSGPTGPGLDRDALGFALALVLLVFLIPTSWTSYQALLALPLAVGVFAAAKNDADIGSRILALAAAGIGCWLFSYSRVFDQHPLYFSILRSALPLFLFASIVRGIRATPPR